MCVERLFARDPGFKRQHARCLNGRNFKRAYTKFRTVCAIANCNAKLSQVEVQPVFSSLPSYGRFTRVEPSRKDPSSGTAVFHMKTEESTGAGRRGDGGERPGPAPGPAPVEAGSKGGTGAFIKVLLILFGSLRNETVCSVMFGFESF